MGKRSVNFRGKVGGKRGLSMRGIVETAKWVGMDDRAIKRMVERCNCGPTDSCENCSTTTPKRIAGDK